MSKETVYKCNLCKKTREERLLVGVKPGPIGAELPDIMNVKEADIHICTSCIKVLGKTIEKRIINKMLPKSEA